MGEQVGSDDEVLSQSRSLHQRVRQVIEDIGPEDAGFLGLARDIAAFQEAHVEPVRRLFAASGIKASELRSIDRIPAVPCDVFRLKRVAAHGADADTRVFRTSGTTVGKRGEHCFRDLSTYQAAALSFGARMLWPLRPTRVIALAPSATETRDSSLSFMIDLFIDELGVPASHHMSFETGLDIGGIREAAKVARAAGDRVLVFGTSFAYVHLFDAEAPGDLSRFQGSAAMITGGFKGRSREVDEGELRQMLSEKLKLEPSRIVGEYGMTELSSQLYEARLTSGDALYRAPPWVRVSAVDPVTLQPLPKGEVEICRIVDLANVDSAVAIQTMDRVRITDAGLELLGRLPGATPRGCSLAVDAILSGD